MLWENLGFFLIRYRLRIQNMISLCYYYYFLEKFCHMSNFDSLGDCDLVYKTYKGIVNPLSNEKKWLFLG